MRDNRPSTTAIGVAFARALAEHGVTRVGGFSDPVAEALIPWPLARIARFFEGRPRLAQAMWLAILGTVEVLPLRTRAIDEVLERAVREEEIRQLVIVGAGLDARAWRLSFLSAVTVFELDHPATQGFKRERLGTRPALAKEVHFLPVNLERESLAVALAAAGHDPKAKTIFIWEGVVMYLEEAAVQASLRAMASVSAPGSLLAMTYFTPAGGASERAWWRLWVAPLVRLAGEPFRATYLPEAMAATAGEAGFGVEQETGAKDWAKRYSVKPDGLQPTTYERLAVARRRAAA